MDAILGENMTKFTITYLDGLKEVIYGSEIVQEDSYFIISIPGDAGDRYISIPWIVVRRLEEE